MFRIENVDKLEVFRTRSSTTRKIKRYCDFYTKKARVPYPTIRTFHREDGEDRGIYFRNTITIFYSTDETPNSMVWVFLHELKHYLMEKQYKLYADFFNADDAMLDLFMKKNLAKMSIEKQLRFLHEVRPTEVICNTFATEVMKKDYGVMWFQTRRSKSKKRKIK